MKTLKYATWGILTLLMVIRGEAQTTPNLNLNIPAIGSTGYAPKINANFSLLDSYLSGGSVLPAISTQSLTLGGTTAMTTTSGTGALARTNNPVFVAPTLGAALGTSLALGGGTPLATTNQSGTGSLCMTNGCALVGPNIGAAVGISLALANGATPALVLSSSAADGPYVSLTQGATLFQLFLDSTAANFRINNPNGVQFFVSSVAPLAVGANLRINDSGGVSIGTGITSAAGFGHTRVNACTTGAGANALCTTTVTWLVPFVGTNYTANCTLNSNSAGAFVTRYDTKVAASIRVEITNGPGGGVVTGNLNCSAEYDAS